MTFSSAAWAFRNRIGVLVVPAIVLLSALVLGFYFFTRGRDIMQEQLRDHLRSTATVAALVIDPALVNMVDGEEDMQGAAFERLLAQIQNVRLSDDSILYA